MSDTNALVTGPRGQYILDTDIMKLLQYSSNMANTWKTNGGVPSPLTAVATELNCKVITKSSKLPCKMGCINVLLHWKVIYQTHMYSIKCLSKMLIRQGC